MKRILIIGGGASGMMAAISAAQNRNNKVVLVERQSRVGRKLLSTGNGRCNLSNTGCNAGSFHGETPAFVSYALKQFGVEAALSFFGELGLMTKTEEGGRVYPYSNQANSVLDILRMAMQQNGVEILTGVQVIRAEKKGGVFSVYYDGGKLEGESLIVACGGCAGSKLGGVMDGYELLKSFGHSRTALYPALTQIRTVPDYPRALKGVRAECGIKIVSGNKCLAENFGELQFTETGISGIAVFEISRAVSTAGGRELRAELDFLPQMQEKEIKAYVRRKCALNPQMAAREVLTGSVHNRLGQMICKYAGILADKTAGELGESEVAAIARSTKAFALKITGVSGFESAQVTAGGIKTSEFCDKTLESRLVKGLFACGEVLDIDGDCGGYNLQWAWSSGHLAGRLGE